MQNSVIRAVMQAAAGALAVYGVSAENANIALALIEPVVLSGVAIYWSWAESKQRKQNATVPELTVEPVEYVAPETPPKGHYLSDRSLYVLSRVDKQLDLLFKTAIINTPHDFVVYHGLRTDAEQDEMIASNRSWVKRSKHQDGKAVDIYIIGKNNSADWDSVYKYEAVAQHIMNTSRNLGIKINWGGDWRQRDLGHFELA